MSTKWEMNPPGKARGEAWGLGTPMPRWLPSSTGKLEGWETRRGDGGKGVWVAKKMMTHEAEMGQMLLQTFDKLLQLWRDLDFLKVSTPLNFKAFGRGFDQVGNHSSSSRQAQQRGLATWTCSAVAISPILKTSGWRSAASLLAAIAGLV